MSTTRFIARLCGLAFLMTTACNNQSENVFLKEWDTPYGTPPFSKITIDMYKPAFLAGIDEQKANVQAIIDNPDA
ncbi:MAG: hypothetical protein IK008_07730, partial [Bacteroidales bacterium]|nr:hypothetical protein [Bacteroidales bacterium]